MGGAEWGQKPPQRAQKYIFKNAPYFFTFFRQEPCSGGLHAASIQESKSVSPKLECPLQYRFLVTPIRGARKGGQVGHVPRKFPC